MASERKRKDRAENAEGRGDLSRGTPHFFLELRILKDLARESVELHILKEFRFRDSEVLIVRNLRTRFAELRILKKLACCIAKKT